MTKFFALNGPYLAWVAERDACLVGHVALRTRPAGPVVDVASEALGQPAGRIGVVARLLVSPDARGARLADRRLSGH
jgi:hypothetical protein